MKRTSNENFFYLKKKRMEKITDFSSFSASSIIIEVLNFTMNTILGKAKVFQKNSSILIQSSLKASSLPTKKFVDPDSCSVPFHGKFKG